MFQSFSRLKREELCLVLKLGRKHPVRYPPPCNKNENPALGKRGRGNSWKILGEILGAATRTEGIAAVPRWWPSSLFFQNTKYLSRSFSFNFPQLLQSCVISISARDLFLFFISFFLSLFLSFFLTRTNDYEKEITCTWNRNPIRSHGSSFDKWKKKGGETVVEGKGWKGRAPIMRSK